MDKNLIFNNYDKTATRKIFNFKRPRVKPSYRSTGPTKDGFFLLKNIKTKGRNEKSLVADTQLSRQKRVQVVVGKNETTKSFFFTYLLVTSSFVSAEHKEPPSFQEWGGRKQVAEEDSPNLTFFFQEIYPSSCCTFDV